jgi:hypothetical protein
MPIQKFNTSEKRNIDVTNFVGDKDRLFFDVATRTFRLGDGVTPGGLVLNTGGGGGGSLTGINDYTTGPIMTLTDVNVNIENSFTIESDEGLNPVKVTSYVLYGITTNNTFTELFRDAANTRISCQDYTTYFYEADIVARNNTTPDYAAFKIKGAIDMGAGASTIAINDQKEIVYAGSQDNYDADVVADDTNDAISIRVRGGTGETLRWCAMVKVTEVTQS